MSRPLGVGHLGSGGGLGQPGRVLRGVVVELVAGHDLARAVSLELRAAADDGDLEVARAREVGLDEGEGVVAEGLVERPVELGGVVDEGHPDRAPEARRLDHQPRVGRVGGERRELRPDRVGLGGPGVGADLAPIDDRQADAAAHALEQRLVHADGRCRDARSGVGEPGRLEERLDRPVLAERAVEGDEHDGCRAGRPPAGRWRRRAASGPATRAPPGRRRRTGPAVAAVPGRAATTSRRRGR